jgi:hypothetical protein
MLESGFRSIRSLAEGCGLAPATLARRIQRERTAGSANVDGQTIRSIAATTGFSAHWIMTGEGSPYLDTEAASETQPGLGPRDRVDWGREVVDGLVSQGVGLRRAQHAVGALLLDRDAEYSSVVELYQASLRKLGYAHTRVRPKSADETNAKSNVGSRVRSTRGSQRGEGRRER